MNITTGHDLLAKELQGIHSAERLLSRALPKFSKQVSSDELRKKLADRLKEGKDILQAVEHELEELDVSVGRKRNLAVEGLLEDTKQLTGDIDSPDVFDAALIAEIQKVQHYCMAAWGTTAAYAREIELGSLGEAMERALKNGKKFDEELSKLAEDEINAQIFDDDEAAEAEENEQETQRSSKQAEGGNGRNRRSTKSGRSSQASR